MNSVAATSAKTTASSSVCLTSVLSARTAWPTRVILKRRLRGTRIATGIRSSQNLAVSCGRRDRSFAARCGRLAWQLRAVPYDLRDFNTIGSISFDHPDPSIFTVLTSVGEAGMANCDFVIFPDRWLVAEDTFRPPWYHRNTMSEYMGLIYGQYDAKEEGFVPAAARSTTKCPPTAPTSMPFEKASNADLKPQHRGTLAFMFESRYIIRPTKFAMETGLQHEYSEFGRG